MRPQATFAFFILFKTFSFFRSPRRSFILVAPSSSFLLVPLSSSSLLPLRPSFFLVQYLLNHLESVKGHFSSILTKALRTNQPTDGPTNGRTDKASYRDARTHLKKVPDDISISLTTMKT